ncbi:MAG: type VII toxin-antitoxin system HepT family RNase toxin [Myxococcota bacterium]
MVDINVLTEKLKALERHLERVRLRAKPTAKELAADEDSLDLVSFHLMLAVQTCLDIANHLIADHGWHPPAKLAESFERLGEHGILSTSTVALMARAGGLRNVVAHAYGKVDVEKVHAAATSGLKDLERFAQEIATWLAAR